MRQRLLPCVVEQSLGLLPCRPDVERAALPPAVEQIMLADKAGHAFKSWSRPLEGLRHLIARCPFGNGKKHQSCNQGHLPSSVLVELTPTHLFLGVHLDSCAFLKRGDGRELSHVAPISFG